MTLWGWMGRHKVPALLLGALLALVAVAAVAAAQPDPERRVVYADPPAPAFVVTHVVDGDTVVLDNGETVRLAGIDTPERGECGFGAAADALARLVEGRKVVLGDSDEDRDRYGRLLRYVDLADGKRGGLDAGLELIKRGLAVARYDSRDGYGRHPREDAYVAADRRNVSVCAQR